MSLFQELRNDARGMAILEEWLGRGGMPVSHEHAEQRADVCLSCREHRPMKWWETAKSAIADTIKRHLEVKQKLDMRVKQEETLGMCSKCGCCVRLKIHVPVELLKSQYTAEELTHWPSICWVRKELI